MHNLTDQDLFSIWEKALDQPALAKSLMILGPAYPDSSFNDLASLSIGERDARLLDIREQLFGSTLQNEAECPACNKKVEWQTPIKAFKLQAFGLDNSNQSLELTYDDHTFQFRLPNTTDLLSLAKGLNVVSQADEIIQKCITDTSFPDFNPSTIKPELKDRIIQKMEESDPQADIKLNLVCPECKHDWVMTFDIVDYLWTEINYWAIEMIHDIYLLARNFGWTEKEILEMSRFRRNAYIQLIVS